MTLLLSLFITIERPSQRCHRHIGAEVASSSPIDDVIIAATSIAIVALCCRSQWFQAVLGNVLVPGCSSVHNTAVWHRCVCRDDHRGDLKMEAAATFEALLSAVFVTTITVVLGWSI